MIDSYKIPWSLSCGIAEKCRWKSKSRHVCKYFYNYTLIINILMFREKWKILLIRHAETLANKNGEQIGYTHDTDVLTPEGVIECYKLAQSLKQAYASIFKENPVYIHRSSTNRTYETMKHVIERLPWNFIIETSSPLLWEIDMGDMIWTKEMAVIKAILHDHTKQIPWWESRLQVGKRMMQYVNWLNPQLSHIIFSHGIAISSLLQEATWKWEERYKKVKNLDIIELDLP